MPALAITFDPHPVALLRPETAPVPLVWPEREIALLKEAGASEVAVFRTGPWLLELSAREFFDRVLTKQLAARGIVEGPNFAFGHDRQGDVTMLGEWCAAAGIGFEVVEATVIDGQLISSSLVRECVSQGRVQEAARFLGRPHRIRGSVGTGAGRGAGLGFPTVNLTDIPVPLRRGGLRRPRLDRWPGATVAGRLQSRSQPDLRRGRQEGRSPLDRFHGRPLRPIGRARFSRAPAGDPEVLGSRRAASARSRRTWKKLERICEANR